MLSNSTCIATSREHVACLTPEEDGNEAVRANALDVSLRVDRMDKERVNAAAVERIRETLTKRKTGLFGGAVQVESS